MVKSGCTSFHNAETCLRLRKGRGRRKREKKKDTGHVRAPTAYNYSNDSEFSLQSQLALENVIPCDFTLRLCMPEFTKQNGRYATAIFLSGLFLIITLV